MFSAMGEVLTSENLIFLLKGAGLSLAMAVLSLLLLDWGLKQVVK